jgi:hypothetical protein
VVCPLDETKQAVNIQHNVEVRRATIAAMENQYVLHIMSAYL